MKMLAVVLSFGLVFGGEGVFGSGSQDDARLSPDLLTKYPHEFRKEVIKKIQGALRSCKKATDTQQNLTTDKVVNLHRGANACFNKAKAEKRDGDSRYSHLLEEFENAVKRAKQRAELEKNPGSLSEEELKEQLKLINPRLYGGTNAEDERRLAKGMITPILGAYQRCFEEGYGSNATCGNGAKRQKNKKWNPEDTQYFYWGRNDLLETAPVDVPTATPPTVEPAK